MATVRATPGIENLNLTDVRRYLDAQGWRLHSQKRNATFFEPAQPQSIGRVILLPESSDLGDYKARMVELISDLAAFENRSPRTVVLRIKSLADSEMKSA